MHAYRGSPALSGFRATRLLRQVQLAYPSVGGIVAEDVYFVQGEESFSAADEKILQDLLGCPPVLSATPPGVMTSVCASAAAPPTHIRASRVLIFKTAS